MDNSIDDKESSVWCLATINDVEQNMKATSYVPSNIIYVKGKVENTIPTLSPDKVIALLRLDTDWYESTKHELIHLYPELTKGGVLIIDDYGHWDGCRKAVDEYFNNTDSSILLNRVDYTGRIGIKP
jgi:O-methyltransferase